MSPVGRTIGPADAPVRPPHRAPPAARPVPSRRPASTSKSDADHAIEAVAHRIDVRDEDHLGEAVGQAAQQVHHGEAAVLVQRAEDLVQHQQRQRLAGALRDHLADGEAERQVGDVFLAAGDDGLGLAVVQQRGPVVLVELQLGVAAVGEVAQERRGEVGEVGPQRGIELGAQIRQRRGRVPGAAPDRVPWPRPRAPAPPALRAARSATSTASAAAALSPLVRGPAPPPPPAGRAPAPRPRRVRPCAPPRCTPAPPARVRTASPRLPHPHGSRRAAASSRRRAAGTLAPPPGGARPRARSGSSSPDLRSITRVMRARRKPPAHVGQSGLQLRDTREQPSPLLARADRPSCSWASTRPSSAVAVGDSLLQP